MCKTEVLPVIENREGFRAALLEWFAKCGKDYPWRRTRDGYAVLVSEVMLQQTQIATVLGKSYYSRFLEIFPDIPALAAAADEPLLKAWEGLGYYRRARMLRETARAIIMVMGSQITVPTQNSMLPVPISPLHSALDAFFGLKRKTADVSSRK